MKQVDIQRAVKHNIQNENKLSKREIKIKGSTNRNVVHTFALPYCFKTIIIITLTPREKKTSLNYKTMITHAKRCKGNQLRRHNQN